MKKLLWTSDKTPVIQHKRMYRGMVREFPDKLADKLLATYPDFIGLDEKAPKVTPDSESTPKDVIIPVGDLALSTRVLDALVLSGIETSWDLAQAMQNGDAAMLAMPGIGPRALEELKEAMACGEDVGGDANALQTGEMNAIAD